MKADIEDEFNIMKWLEYDDKHEVGYNIVEAYLNHYKGQDYSEGICKKCEGELYL